MILIDKELQNCQISSTNIPGMKLILMNQLELITSLVL
jgi:hypothetical protein